MPDCMRRPLDDWGREFEEWVDDELTELDLEWDEGKKSRGILFDIWRAIMVGMNKGSWSGKS